MSTLEQDARLNRRLAHDRPGRRFSAIDDAAWGELIDRPPYGSYNFHPADLAHHHGADAAPFGDIAERDAKTTVWSVHQVTEVVDAGPVIGQSPPVYIRDREGDVPEPMLMFNKMLYPLGTMVQTMIEALLERFAEGKEGHLEHVDFAGRFPADVKVRMQEPVADSDALTSLTESPPVVVNLD